MTNAEAIKVLEQIRQWTDYPKEALTMAIEALSKPGLHSNLDEAAEEYEHNLGYYECVNQWPSVSFKAGAEWMAGKFQKIEGNLVDWYETNGVDYCHGISTNESFEVPEGFYIKKKEIVL